MNIIRMRDAIVAGMTSAMPTLTSVVAHGGRFTEQELMRFSTSVPCGLVVPWGARGSRQVGTLLVMDVDWIFFIVARGTSQLSRHSQSLMLLATAARAIFQNRWGYPNAQVAQNIKWECLYNSSVDSKGIAINAVTWTQGVALDAEFSASDFEEFQTAYTDIAINQGDEIVRGVDIVELEQ